MTPLMEPRAAAEGVGARRAVPKGRQKPVALWQHRALRAEWAKFSPNLSWECSEDEARHRWASEVLHRPVASWAHLTFNEANRLIKVLKEQSGSNAAWRAEKLARLALELWGADWDRFLGERWRERFGVGAGDSARPGQAQGPAPTGTQFHEMAEELLSRIARRDGAGIEEVRGRFFRARGK